MGKTKKQRPLWQTFAKGLLLSLGIYLVGHLLLAALMVRGALGEEGAFSVTAALCVMASLCGALLVVRHSPWGPLPGGVMAAALFGVVLLVVGGLCWQSITWTGRGGVLLACVFSGGVLAGVLGARRRKGKRLRAL